MFHEASRPNPLVKPHIFVGYAIISAVLALVNLIFSAGTAIIEGKECKSDCIRKHIL